MNTEDQLSDLDPKKITAHLTQGIRHFNPKTAGALQQVRERALENKLAHKPVLALETGDTHHWLPHSTEQWLALTIFVIVILVGSINYWHHSSHQVTSSPFDIASAQLDIAILTDNLPMQVFID